MPQPAVEGKNQSHPRNGLTVPFLRLLPGFHLFTGQNSDGAQDKGSWLLTPWTTYSPGYFCPHSLSTKLAVRLQEEEETADSVQAWLANTEKNKQRLQKEAENLTVDLKKARNSDIQEYFQHKLDQQDLSPGTGSPGKLRSALDWSLLS